MKCARLFHLRSKEGRSEWPSFGSGVYIGPISGGEEGGVTQPMWFLGLHTVGNSERNGQVGWASYPQILSFLWGKESIKRLQVQLDQWDEVRSKQFVWSCSPALCPTQWGVDSGCWGRVVCERQTNRLSFPGGSVASSP